jgi:hypothetical protein
VGAAQALAVPLDPGLRAMMVRWISFVPSPMIISGVS